MPWFTSQSLSPTPQWFLKKQTFCGFSMGSNQYWAVRSYDLCVYFMTGLPKAQPKVFFGEAGNQIKTCDPFSLAIKYLADTAKLQKGYIFVAVLLGYSQYWPGGCMVLWFICPGTPEGSTCSGSGFKRLRRRAMV